MGLGVRAQGRATRQTQARVRAWFGSAREIKEEEGEGMTGGAGLSANREREREELGQRGKEMGWKVELLLRKLGCCWWPSRNQKREGPEEQ